MEPTAKVRVGMFDDLVYVEPGENAFDPNDAWSKVLQLLVRIVAGRRDTGT